MPNDEHHDQRYEDGDMSTGTVADYEDWLSEDGESQWLPVPPWTPIQTMTADTGRAILRDQAEAVARLLTARR